MSLPPLTAPARGGFSAPAFAAATTIISALGERRGFEKIGRAVVALIETRTGCILSPKSADFEPQILGALSLIFEAQSENTLSLKNEASNPPPAPPERERKEKKEPLSFPNQSQNDEGKERDFSSFGPQNGNGGPSFEEWEAYAKSIGWLNESEYSASYRSQTERIGWRGVKSWKGLCACFARNAAAKAEKAEKLAGAFGGGK